MQTGWSRLHWLAQVAVVRVYAVLQEALLTHSNDRLRVWATTWNRTTYHSRAKSALYRRKKMKKTWRSRLRVQTKTLTSKERRRVKTSLRNELTSIVGFNRIQMVAMFLPIKSLRKSRPSSETIASIRTHDPKPVLKTRIFQFSTPMTLWGTIRPHSRDKKLLIWPSHGAKSLAIETLRVVVEATRFILNNTSKKKIPLPKRQPITGRKRCKILKWSTLMTNLWGKCLDCSARLTW